MTDILSDLPEQRLRFLYSDFSGLKQSNASSYRASVDWWLALLLKLTPHASNDTLVLHCNATLLKCLDVKGKGRPLALGAVIAELVPKDLIPLDDFMTSPHPLNEWEAPGSSWAPWLVSNVVVRPLWWALKQISLVDDHVDPAKLWSGVQGDFVPRELVENLVRDLLPKLQTRAHQPLTSRLFSYAAFRRTYGLAHLSPMDLRVLLRYLKRDASILVFDPQKEVVKLLDDPALQREGLITETDVGIVQVYETRRALEEQIAELEGRIADRTTKIKAHLAAKQMAQAKSHLRSRKGLEELLDKRTGAHATLEQVVLKIETAAGDVEIMKSYELASKTLSDLLKAPELAMERVDSTMVGLQEALADQKEVEDALSAGVDEGVDEGELEAELKELQEREVVGRAEQADGSSKNTAVPVEEVQTSRVPEAEETSREAVPA